VPSTEAGYAALVAWVEEFGTLERAGIEGSGSFGVRLARFLRARGVEVVEVNRPNRQHRRRFGKHDTAARALQANTATGEPKSADGPAEMVRTLHVARRSALKARTGTRMPRLCCTLSRRLSECLTALPRLGAYP
jgi:transposase